ncbi:MAG: phage terminase small subunit P27 family [Methylococcales bacterium]
MARPPLPTNLKIIKGTQRKDRLNKSEPKPKVNSLSKPDYLTPVASDYWDRIYPDLSDAKIISTLDYDALAMLCESYAYYRHALEELQTHGAVMTNRDGALVRSPYLMVMQKAFEQLKSMLSEFGMSPASRTKISTFSGVDTTPTGWDTF